MSVTLEEIRLYLRVDGNSDDDLIETLKDSAEQICSDILRNDDPDVLYGNLTEKQEDFNAFMESVPNKVLNALVNTFSALNITNEDNLKN